jgi:High potential iron-sulfur protein
MGQANFSRRKVIESGLLLVPAFAFPASLAKAAATACADPTDSLRASLHYAEMGPDAKATCAGCGFFEADGNKACGNCKIFNGPANAKGHCDSWSAKG